MTITATAAATVTAAFAIDRKPLADAVKLLCKVAEKRKEKRNTIPITTAVRAIVTGDTVALSVTDLDIQLSASLPCDDGAPGAMLLPTFALRDSLAKLKGTRVRISDTGGAIAIQDLSTGTVTRLAYVAENRAADWPALALSQLDAPCTFDAAQLRDDLARVSVAISSDETRYYLNGVHAHIDDGGAVLRMVTTDGHKLIRVTRPAPVDYDAADNGQALAKGVIMPRKAIATIGALIGAKGKGEAALAFSSTQFTFAYGHWTIASKLIDGTFPHYQRVIPSDVSRGIDVGAELFADTVSAVTAHCDPKNTRAVSIAAGVAGWLTASAVDPENGTAAALIETRVSALSPPDKGGKVSDVETAFNAAYMRAIAGIAFEGAESLAIRFADASAPMRIEALSVPHILAVLMPLRASGAMTPDAVRALNGTPAPAVAPVTPEHDDEPAAAPVAAPAPVIAPEPAPAAVSEPIAANDDDTPAAAPDAIDAEARMAAADVDAIAALEAAGCPATTEAACNAIWNDYVAGIVGATANTWGVETGRRQADRKARNRGKVLIAHSTYVYLRDRFNALPPFMPSPCLAPVVAAAPVADAAPVVTMPSPCPRDDSAAGIAARLANVEAVLGIAPAVRPARTPAHLRAIRAYLKARADRAAAAAERKRLHDAAVSLAQLLQDEQRDHSETRQTSIERLTEVRTANALVASLTAELTEERATLARLAPVVAAMEALHRPALAAAA